MLNARLYRTCWLVAGVALVVALLTLETPDPGPEPVLPSDIDGQTTLLLDREMASIAPERAAGSGPDQAAARWVRDQLAGVFAEAVSFLKSGCLAPVDRPGSRGEDPRFAAMKGKLAQHDLKLVSKRVETELGIPETE